VVTAAVVVLAIAVTYYGLTVARVVWTGHRSAAGHADAIVVLGAAQYDGRPSPELAARLDEAVALWRRGTASLVAVTGGRAPGDRFTEAQASAAYLRARGVPGDAVVSEETGRTTWESVTAIAPVLRGRGVHRVVVVSSSYHVLRSRSMLAGLGFDVTSSAPGDDRIGASTWARHVLKEAVGVAYGDLAGYDRLEDVNP
jgi:uncharacterized SAM-binding protein YcdF (DUF218 family)